MPAYQNDLSTLSQVVSPAYAAQQAGIQNDAANQEQQLANQKAAAELPFAAQKEQAGIGLTTAQAGNLNAEAQKTGLANMFTQQTQPGSIAAANAKSNTEVTQEHLNSISQLGQLAGAVAQQMDSVPAPARPAAMQHLLSTMGVNQDQLQQSGLGSLMSGDPDQLRQFSQQAIQASASFQQQSALESQKAQAHQNVATTEGQYHLASAQASADARKYAADQKRVIDQMKQTVDQSIAQLTQRIGSPNEQPGDKERLQFLAQQQAQVRQLQAQNMSQLTGMGMPATPSLNIGGGGGQPHQAPSGPAPNADATKQAATQAFGSYEPDKYEYGINPQTGKFARRPK